MSEKNFYQTLYRFGPDDRLNEDAFNQRFLSIDARLREIRQRSDDLDAVLEELRQIGIQRLTESLQATLPGILEGAQAGYLVNLSDSAIPWVKLDKTGAAAADIGAASLSSLSAHTGGLNVHSIGAVSGLAAALSAKQDYSTILRDISISFPSDGALLVGNGSSFGPEQLVAGSGIQFQRDPQAGTWTINALNASGEVQGEANTVTNIGTGTGIFAAKSGVNFQLRSLGSSHSALTWAIADDRVNLSLNEALLQIPIAAVANLAATLADKQPLSTRLTGLAEANLTAGHFLRVAGDGALASVPIVAGANIAIAASGSGIEISAAASGEANSGTNLGAGTPIYRDKSGTALRFRTLVSQAPFLTLSGTTDLVQFDFSVSGLAAAFADNAIAWSKVSKAGATPTSVGAEPAGAVSAHAGGSGVHAIAAVTGLQTALDGRLTRVLSSTQEMNTSLAIAPTTANIGSYTPNAAGQNYWVLTQTSNSTINNPTGLTSGRVQFLDFTIIQDGTGGRSLGWGNNFVWGDAGQPVHKTNANAVNLYSFKAWGGKLYFLGHRSY